MAGSKPKLQRGLDRDVYQAVCKILKNESDSSYAQDYLSVRTIYEKIKRSNSVLSRKSKVLLEDSIERILDVIHEDQAREEGSGTDSLIEEASQKSDSQAQREKDASNAMNMSIRKSFQRNSKPKMNGVNGTKGNPTYSPAQPASLGESEPEYNHSPIRKHSDHGKHQVASRSQSDSPHPAKRKRKYLHKDPSTRNPNNRAISHNSAAPPTHITLADLGGLDHIISFFTETILLPLHRPQRYLDRGLKIPRGILLHGPPGCGKTLLCEAIAAELGLPFLSIAAPSIVSGMSGESEKALRGHFDRAVSLAPCLMFIDEIDAITPKRESAQREMERRIVGQLLTCLDDLALEKTGGKPVIVLAATNRPDSIDPALRRAGRFDTELNIGVPGVSVREQILRAQTRRTCIADDVDFAELAKKTPGFVGADLENLVGSAGAKSNARYLVELKKLAAQQPSSHNDEANGFEALDNDIDMAEEGINGINSSTAAPVLASSDAPKSASETVTTFRQLNALLSSANEPPSIQSSDAITMDDFLQALPHIQPTAKREGFATIPDTTWDSVGALRSVRAQLHTAIVAPIQRSEHYARFGINAPAGVLLWGPPGCGKTLLAKAVANESKANFISVKGPELLNKWVGESERAVRQVFFRAKASQPCVVFFDELDALVPRRDDSLSEASSRVVNTLLTELDGMTARTGIYVIAATNRPEMIDPAMLRPGRLGKHLFVGLPGPLEREEIFKTRLRGLPARHGDSALTMFARDCVGFSGADLSQLVYEAAQGAVERGADFLELSDLQNAKREIRPSVGDMAKYERLKSSLTAR